MVSAGTPLPLALTSISAINRRAISSTGRRTHASAVSIVGNEARIGTRSARRICSERSFLSAASERSGSVTERSAQTDQGSFLAETKTPRAEPRGASVEHAEMRSVILETRQSINRPLQRDDVHSVRD